MKYTLYIIFLLFYIFPLSSIDLNNIRFIQSDINNDLPSRTVFAINSDKNGMIWIGTNSGLSKYDGYNVESYYARNNQISSDLIYMNYLDNNGDIWFLTENGINKYNYETNSFSIYLKQEVGNLRVNTIIDNNGAILVGTSNGLFKYNETTDIFSILSIQGADLKGNINTLMTDSRNNLWIQGMYELYYFDNEKNNVINYTDKLYSSCNKAGVRIIRFKIDSSDRLWIHFSDSSVGVFDPNNDSKVVFLHDESGNLIKEIKTFEKDEDNNIWIGSDDGIHIYDMGLNLVRHIKRDIYDDTNINDNSIYSIFKDASGNMWIGSYFAAINQYINRSDNIKTYSFGYTPNHLSGNVVRQIIEDDKNRIWIATEDGSLNIMDNTGINRINLSHKGEKVTNTHSLLKDSKDDIWIGTYGYGLYHYSHKSGKFRYIENFHEKMIFSLKEDSLGNIWVGSTRGIFVKSKNSDNFNRLDEWADHLRWSFGYSLLPDSNKLWVGTLAQGLFLLDTQKKRVKKIDAGEEIVTSIFIINRIGDNIWIASNNGLLLFDREANFIRRFSMSDGLPSNEIKTIVEDNNGSLWITTNSGLCLMDSKNFEIEIFTDKDGLPANQFNYSSGYLTSDNKLFFGTFNGMISFDPAKIDKSSNQFPVMLTSVNAGGERIVDDFSTLNDITLSYKRARSIFLEFSGMNYKYLNNTQYKFRLDGVYNNWQQMGKSHLIQLYNLNPGRYVLTVVAGAENEWDYDNAKTLNIKIKPPFWLSTSAYLIYALIILIILYLIYVYMKFRLTMRMKLKTERENLSRIEEMNQKRTNFFSYISHDLRTPLTLIISPLQQLTSVYDLDKNTGRKISIALSNARKINNLIDQMLLFSKFENREAKINVECSDIRDTIFDIISGFEIIATERKIEFIHNVEITKSNVYYSSMSLERIIYNLLSNAVKFTPEGGKIIFNINNYTENGSDFISCEISDTGCGISKNKIDNIFENYYQLNPRDEKSGYGLGLPLVRNLISLHKGDISIKSEEGKGTTIHFFVNVSEAAFEQEEKYIVHKLSNEDNFLYVDEHDNLEKESIISNTSGNKILIVEDNIELNNYLKDTLSEFYNVEVAFDGESAYEKASKGDFDLILSDVMMPKMDGNQLTNKIKTDVLTSHILVILLSAKIEPDAKTEGFKNGADAYLPKPFNPDDLLKMISNLLKTRNNIINRYKISDDTPVVKLGTNKRDEEFLNKIESLVLENIQKDNFGIEEICEEMNISRSLLYLKLKKLTDSSASEFIKTIKMKEAKKRMMEGHNVSEASYLVGIFDPNYFTKCFKKQFGISPSEFIKQISKVEITKE